MFICIAYKDPNESYFCRSLSKMLTFIKGQEHKEWIIKTTCDCGKCTDDCIPDQFFMFIDEDTFKDPLLEL